MISKKILALKRHTWERLGNFIIGFDEIKSCYGVWERDSTWYEFNPVSEYFLTIEEARQFIDNLS